MTQDQVSDAVHTALFQGLESRESDGVEEPFFVCDLGHLQRQYQQWQECLPRADPHYAVKCNVDQRVLQRLAQLGTGFDCASETELRAVLSLGVDSNRIIYAHPCKNRKGLRYARANGVHQMTFDNADELPKIKQEHPEAQLYLRILADDPGAKCRLGLKYGASLSESRRLLELAAEYGLDVCGVSFHVGSGASDALVYRQALHDARAAFDYGAKCGFEMHTVDIGGGFTQDSFRSFAPTISAALDEFFPSPKVRVIAEPGRYFAEGSMTLACSVTARRPPSQELDDEESMSMLYLNDGCYGSFGNCVWEGFSPKPSILRSQQSSPTESAVLDHKTWRYILWGPTCDSADCMSKNWEATQEVNVDDWLYFDGMGAYTTATVTEFNGFSNERDIFYVDTSAPASKLDKRVGFERALHRPNL